MLSPNLRSVLRQLDSRYLARGWVPYRRTPVSLLTRNATWPRFTSLKRNRPWKASWNCRIIAIVVYAVELPALKHCGGNDPSLCQTRCSLGTGFIFFFVLLFGVAPCAFLQWKRFRMAPGTRQVRIGGGPVKSLGPIKLADTNVGYTLHNRFYFSTTTIGLWALSYTKT